MDIKRAGSSASTKGPAEYFTGIVRIDPLFSVAAPARGAGNAVAFEPGARTAWHTHPLGQVLIITMGSDGRSARAVRSKSSAQATSSSSRRARKTLAWRCLHHRHDPHRRPEALDGKAVEWMEKVSDEQYQAQGPFRQFRGDGFRSPCRREPLSEPAKSQPQPIVTTRCRSDSASHCSW